MTRVKTVIYDNKYTISISTNRIISVDSGVFVWRVKKQARDSVVETFTVTKQIGEQVSLRVRDKQQLITTINEQKRINKCFRE
jgi:hypothetical protein